MSEQEKKQTLEEEIKTKLNGDSQKNALDFAAFLDKSKAYNYFGEDVCFIVIFPPNWYVMVSGANSSICNTERDDLPINDTLREFTWANVGQCPYYNDKERSCCGNPGHSFTVLGKKFDNCCNCPICFQNPNAETLKKIKTWVEACKLCITEIKRTL